MRVLLKELDALKTRGNEAFAAGRFDEAIERYTEVKHAKPQTRQPRPWNSASPRWVPALLALATTEDLTPGCDGPPPC